MKRFGGNKARGSPKHRIRIPDRRGALKIDWHQLAPGRDNKVLGFAISPGPAGAMHLVQKVRDLNSQRQHAINRQAPRLFEQEMVEALAIDEFHHQIGIAFEFEAGINLWHVDSVSQKASQNSLFVSHTPNSVPAIPGHLTVLSTFL